MSRDQQTRVPLGDAEVMKMGLTISEWGPAAWNTLHVVAHSYPTHPTSRQRDETWQFLHLFALHLPCPSCRQHFQSLLQSSVPTSDATAFDSRESLVKFMNDAHNEVNVRLGKRIYTLEEHYRVYRPTKSGIRTQQCTCMGLLFLIGLCACMTWRRHAVPKKKGDMQGHLHTSLLT